MDHLEDDGDLPPPYSPNPNASSSTSIQHPDPQSYSSLFSAHVANLRTQISASQAYRASATDDRDSYILSIIYPRVEEFISSISEIYPTPRLAEAILVPDAAVSNGWKFNDEDDTRDGEYRRLIRVCEAKKKDGSDEKQWPSEKGSGSNETNDGISPTLWWESESTALRLAKHLQPQRPASSPTDGQAAKTRSKKSGIRGLFKRSEDAPQNIASKEERPVERVTMTTRAEEITFRKENECGIWETRTGWGVILRVRIHSS
ncbi:uncharacterized protein TrAtP1_009239 [Trichoderma atroviride]|uniref:Uncharacterized protein n=1 Tax=Hypocrea atroviridis (strain ATCC 20476 / IMI 206040) TaxID=452589 RepID=G9NEH2_HYPAI|nr:uncharacterized protein TRIATDRAFT_279760 [Trichoderma atroviride IMI 206040]EHK50870.1 hypothetical protein TRIATDRAFT_279760 [Trichoderma atroviride IMI 206040]UKZ68204.1 hypothetical protein TrAtP1_009239 [Trichoderma atroviride]